MGSSPPDRTAPGDRHRTAKLVGVTASLVVLTAAHVTAPPHWHEFHAILFNIAFVPLIFAGLWFHVRGAVVAAALTSAMSLAHLFLQLSPGHSMGPTATVALIVLYNVVAFTTGFLSQRWAQAVARAEAHAAALETNARTLLRAEEAVARSERLRALGELAAGVAHEIRNPLGGVRGAAEVLAKDATPPAIRREFGTLMETEIERIDRVVRNFLQFARPTPANVARVRAAEVVDAVFLLLGPEARRREVALENAVPPELAVLADADLFRQVILNVVLNALQSQDGAGFVRASAREKGGAVELDVADGGPGVAPDVRGTLFDAFVTTRSDGSGLGLAIADRLTKSMGGRIELASSADTGSVFRVTLPRADAAPRVPAAADVLADVPAERAAK